MQADNLEKLYTHRYKGIHSLTYVIVQNSAVEKMY